MTWRVDPTPVVCARCIDCGGILRVLSCDEGIAFYLCPLCPFVSQVGGEILDRTPDPTQRAAPAAPQEAPRCNWGLRFGPDAMSPFHRCSLDRGHNVITAGHHVAMDGVEALYFGEDDPQAECREKGPFNG